MSEQPWSFQDRRGWRWGYGGRPVDLAKLVIDRLCGRSNLNLLAIFTGRSRRHWETGLSQQSVAEEWARKSLDVSMNVAYPAAGMAYVFLESATGSSPEVLTLLFDQDIQDWRVHQIGAPASPLTFGLKPFPPRREPWEPTQGSR